MTFTSPFTAVTGAVITAAGWNTSARDNLLHLRNLLPDPASAGLALVSTSTTAAIWQAVSDLTTGVPSGLIAAFETAAAIPTGWTRYTAADGRILVGAGTTFSVTFTEATNYGSSWSHGHTGGSHIHTAAALGIGGSMGGPSTTVGITSGGGNEAARNNHTHDFSQMDITGTTDAGGNVSTSSDAWTIPSRAVVWAKKD